MKEIKYWKNKSYSFFSNCNCEYFPCHKTENVNHFNCLFCFCPLYEQDDCGGSYTYLKNGCKDCSGCVTPHQKDNYGIMIERLQKNC